MPVSSQKMEWRKLCSFHPWGAMFAPSYTTSHVFLCVSDFQWFLRLRDGRGSSIRSEFAWHASGPEFDPHIRHILSWRLGHENISTAITLFRWFKKSSCQLLAKECALSTGKLPRRLAQEQFG